MSYFVRITPKAGGVELIDLDAVIRIQAVDLDLSYYELLFANGTRGVYRLTVSTLRNIILLRQNLAEWDDIGRYDPDPEPDPWPTPPSDDPEEE